MYIYIHMYIYVRICIYVYACVVSFYTQHLEQKPQRLIIATITIIELTNNQFAQQHTNAKCVSRRAVKGTDIIIIANLFISLGDYSGIYPPRFLRNIRYGINSGVIRASWALILSS